MQRIHICPCRAFLQLLISLLTLHTICSRSTHAEQQRAERLPVFQLDAAWTAALRAGPSAGAAATTLAGSSALEVSRLSLQSSNVYSVKVPPGNWSLQGHITVSNGQMLVLQGAGGLLVPGQQQTPATTWILANSSIDTVSINISPGGVAFIRNMTLVRPTLSSSLDSPGVFIPQPFHLPASSPWAGAFLMEHCALVLDSCTALEGVQYAICQMRMADSDIPWPVVEMEPGWAFLFILSGYQSNITLSFNLYVCSWSLPTLGDPETISITPAHLPTAPPIEGSPLLTASLVHMDPAGLPVNSTLHNAFNLTPVEAVSSQAQPRCVGRVVQNPQQLMRAVAELQPMSAHYAIITLIRNISFSPGSETRVWPHQDLALWIYKSVIITGRHVARARVTEIDFALLRNLYWMGNSSLAQLKLQSLVLANMPCGPKELFPYSLMVLQAWPFAWDRLHANRTYLGINNSTLILPEGNFKYQSFWVGMAYSPVPSMRDRASWQGIQSQGLVEMRGNHTLFVRKRWGEGIQWSNSSITDLAGVSPLRPIHCGLSHLVPWDDTYPYTYVTPVANTQQLAQYLKAPPTPVMILLYNMSLDVQAMRDVAGADRLLVNTSVKVLGWWEGDTVLDLHNAADVFDLQLPTEQQVTLQRMYLTGLGPASALQQPQQLANWTCMLWAFDSERSMNPVLSLQNTTLIVPDAELAQLKALTSESRAGAQSSSTASSRQATRTATGGPSIRAAAVQGNSPDQLSNWLHFANDWESGRVRASQVPGTLAMSQIVWPGINAKDLVISSRLPHDLAGLTVVTPEHQDLMLNGKSDVQGTQSLRPADAQETGGGFKPWQVAVLVVGISCALLLAVSMAAWWRLRRQRAAKQAELAKPDLGGGTTTGTAKIAPGTSSDQSRPDMHPSGSSGHVVLPIIPPGSTFTSDTQSGDSLALRRLHPLLDSGMTPKPGMMVTPQGAISGGAAMGMTLSGSSRLMDTGEPSAPDEEIRQLVHVQRERERVASQALAIGVRGGGGEGETVQLDVVLGQGAHGVVYRGRWRGMTVAVKVITFLEAGPAARHARQRAVNEAAVNTMLTHDNICNMYAYDLRPVAASGLPDERLAAHYRLYIIQEYCDAGSLAQAIDQGLFMDPDTGQRKLVAQLMVACEIARGLQYIHSRNVIHGDLSAGNIMLKSDATQTLGLVAKIADFGLSRFLESPDKSHISNARQGTPAYLAPEVMSHGIISKQADCFALGVILWELYYATVPPWRDPALLDPTTRVGNETHALFGPPPTPPTQPPTTPSTPYPPPYPSPAMGQAAGQARAAEADHEEVMGYFDSSHTTQAQTLAEEQNEMVYGESCRVQGPHRQAEEGGTRHTAAEASGMETVTSGGAQRWSGTRGRVSLAVFPLPADCPAAYVQLVGACLHPIPKARPRLPIVVGVLERILAEVEGTPVNTPYPPTTPPIWLSPGLRFSDTASSSAVVGSIDMSAVPVHGDRAPVLRPAGMPHSKSQPLAPPQTMAVQPGTTSGPTAQSSVPLPLTSAAPAPTAGVSCADQQRLGDTAEPCSLKQPKGPTSTPPEQHISSHVRDTTVVPSQLQTPVRGTTVVPSQVPAPVTRPPLPDRRASEPISAAMLAGIPHIPAALQLQLETHPSAPSHWPEPQLDTQSGVQPHWPVIGHMPQRPSPAGQTIRTCELFTSFELPSNLQHPPPDAS